MDFSNITKHFNIQPQQTPSIDQIRRPASTMPTGGLSISPVTPAPNPPTEWDKLKNTISSWGRGNQPELQGRDADLPVSGSATGSMFNRNTFGDWDASQRAGIGIHNNTQVTNYVDPRQSATPAPKPQAPLDTREVNVQVPDKYKNVGKKPAAKKGVTYPPKVTSSETPAALPASPIVVPTAESLAPITPQIHEAGYAGGGGLPEDHFIRLDHDYGDIQKILSGQQPQMVQQVNALPFKDMSPGSQGEWEANRLMENRIAALMPKGESIGETIVKNNAINNLGKLSQANMHDATATTALGEMPSKIGLNTANARHANVQADLGISGQPYINANNFAQATGRLRDADSTSRRVGAQNDSDRSAGLKSRTESAVALAKAPGEIQKTAAEAGEARDRGKLYAIQAIHYPDEVMSHMVAALKEGGVGAGGSNSVNLASDVAKIITSRLGVDDLDRKDPNNAVFFNLVDQVANQYSGGSMVTKGTAPLKSAPGAR